MSYTNRSRIQAFQDCPRLGFITYHWGGLGLVPKKMSIYLGTGQYVHRGIALVLKHIKASQDKGEKPTIPMQILDNICWMLNAEYNEALEERGISLKPDETTEPEQYYVAEQIALVEGQIRAFAYRILPQFVHKYRVLAVEEELPPIQISSSHSGPVLLESRPDAVLSLHENPEHIELLSLKTAGSYRKRQDEANSHDLQGLCETLSYEAMMEQQERPIVSTIAAVKQLGKVTEEAEVATASNDYAEWLKLKLGPDRIAGILMIFLVKGKRVFQATGKDEEGNETGFYETASPLIRGWRKWDPTLGWQYAHSWYYPNSENKSGKGSLGRGWEMFRAWEVEQFTTETMGKAAQEAIGGVKGWIKLLASNKIQPECGDILMNQFVVPQIYYRNQDSIDSFRRQLEAEESNLTERVHCVCLSLRQDSPTPFQNALDIYFPQHRSSCHDYFGGNCPCIPICYNKQIFAAPLASGLYQVRVPHHAAELASLKEELGKK